MELPKIALHVLWLGAPLIAFAPSCIHDSRDVHRATALPERRPASIATRTYPLCVLVGPRNHDPGVYGTDLGVTVKLPDAPGRISDRLAIFFGDTWAKAGDACKYPVAHSDDLEAWLPSYRPASLRVGAPSGDERAACGTLEYALDDRKDATSWPRVRLFASTNAKHDDEPLDTGMLRAPGGAFSDGKVTYVMYGSDPVTCDTSKQCPESMLCSTDPTYSGKSIGQCSGAFAKALNGVAAYCRNAGDCAAAAKCEKPAHGVCLSTRPFTVRSQDGAVAPTWYADDPRRGIAHVGLIAAGIWPDRPSDYAVVVRFPTNKFTNVATRTVRYFDPDDPRKNDYRPGNHTLLMWGRAAFAEKGGAQTLPFLLYQPLEQWRSGAPREWRPRFFAGHRADGRPVWSERESDAQPIYGAPSASSGGARLAWSEPEFDYVNQMSFAWVEPLRRWVMLYGGDDPAFIVLDPGSATAPPPVHLQRSPGAIHFRVARHPWGRAGNDDPAEDGFSSAEPVLTRRQAAPYLACGDGGEKELPGCLQQGDPNGPLDLFGTLANLSTKLNVGGFAEVTAKCLGGAVAMAGQSALSGNPIGRLYGVNVIQEWTAEVKDPTAPGQRAAEIYWNASTWNPYQVVLFKTELRVTEDDVRR